MPICTYQIEATKCRVAVFSVSRAPDRLALAPCECPAVVLLYSLQRLRTARNTTSSKSCLMKQHDLIISNHSLRIKQEY